MKKPLEGEQMLMENERNRKKNVWLKGVLIFEVIVCYMAVLNIVSHLRGPQQYVVISDVPLLTASNFIPFGENDVQEASTLQINNEVQGVPTGHWANLPLSRLNRIFISFQLECPQKYAGGILSTDLYNEACGYDREDQEFRLTLQEGLNDVSAWIDVSDSAPDEAQLRIFTVDIADYEVTDLGIFQAVPVPRVTVGMTAVTIVCFLLLGTTLVLYWRVSRPQKAR